MHGNHRGSDGPRRRVHPAGLLLLLQAAGCARGPTVEGWIRPGDRCVIRSGSIVASGESPAPEHIAWSDGGAPRVYLFGCAARANGGNAEVRVFVGAPSPSLPTGRFPIGRDRLARRRDGAEVTIFLPERGRTAYLVGVGGYAEVVHEATGAWVVRFAASTVRKAPP